MRYLYPLMRFRSFLPFLVLLLLFSCKSEFERVRLSGDVDKIYETGMAYYKDGDYLKAQTLFELIVNNFRGRKEAEDLYFKYANTHFLLKNYILAAYYFNNFKTTFPLSSLREEAEYMAAYSNFKLSPVYRLDQDHTKKAIEGLQDFVNSYPSSERVQECNQLIDGLRAKLEEKAFEEARLYYDLREYQAALHCFENLLKDFPGTRNAERVRYLMVDAAYAWASNSVREKRTERYEKVLEYVRLFRAKYPKSKFASDIRKTESLTKTALKSL